MLVTILIAGFAFLFGHLTGDTFGFRNGVRAESRRYRSCKNCLDATCKNILTDSQDDSQPAQEKSV